jgi:uncharacterized membrane-anchored protein YjiN (DUF445 family)
VRESKVAESPVADSPVAESTAPAGQALGLDPEQQQRDLRRMKAVAAGVLLVAAVIYLLTRRAEAAGAPAWVGFVRAAAEAGMVGGLADWFAVTALFRHPLGLPIPHTAIIPTRKDALGRSLGSFIGANFLAEPVVRDKVRRSQLSRRVGGWLGDPRHAARVSTELATVVRAGLNVLRDDDVQDMIDSSILPRLASVPLGPPAGRLLGDVVTAGAHHGAVDLVADNAHRWLVANRDRVITVVASQAPDWSPAVLDRQVGARVHTDLVRVAAAVVADQQHPMRVALDAYLGRLAADLREDPPTMARAAALQATIIARPEVRRLVGDLLEAARRLALELVEDPAGPLRARVTDALVELGTRLRSEPELQAKVDGWLEEAVAYVVVTFRDELTTTVTDTVERWDGVQTARKVELQVGRDLQFIRLNGTVVGALVGVAIHAVDGLVF